MDTINLDHQRLAVLWATFAVGLLFGAVSHRSRFCTMGALADILNYGNWGRMRMWLLAIGTASLGLQILHIQGNANLHDTLYLNPQWPWLSGILGGLMFGLGMVLASGCGSKTLVRLGNGSLKSFVVFLLTGLSSYITLKGLVAMGRVNYLDPHTLHWPLGNDLPSILSQTFDAPELYSAIGFSISGALILLALLGKHTLSKSMIIGGLSIGSVIIAAWWVVFDFSYLPEHPDTLEAAYLGSYTNRAEGLSFIAPYGYSLEWLMFYSDQNRLLTIGPMACFGVVIGSFISSLHNKTFQWETFQGVEDTANHMVGAIFMGIGGITATGCTVGQGLSGASTLALPSWITLFSMMMGAALAIRYQTWRVSKTS